jgi:hypothetical protein
MDGVDLKGMEPGVVREVSASIGSWLIAEGYAEPEMRRTPSEDSHHTKAGRLSPDRRSHRRF